MNWNEINRQSPINQHYAYFDTGAAAPPPQAVIERVQQYLSDCATQGTYLPSFRAQVYQDIEQTRSKLAQFIGADVSEIAFTKNGTESISIIAQGIDFQAGDEVIVPDTEMISNIAIWYQLQQQKKIKVVRVKADSETLIDLKVLEAAITPKTKLISFVALSNVTGARQQVKAICALAKRHNVMTHVNATQAVGMIDFSVADWQCDLLSGCGRKGLRAIEGSGFLYVRRALINQIMPCLIGWWNASLDGETVVLPDTAKRFEAGCPITPAIYSMDAALDIANDIGMCAIEQRVHDLTAYALESLADLSVFEYYGPRQIEYRMGLIPFNIKGVEPQALVKYLESQDIIIEAGHFMAGAILDAFNITAMARISLHYFNDEAQIDRLVFHIRQFISEQ